MPQRNSAPARRAEKLQLELAFHWRSAKIFHNIRYANYLELQCGAAIPCCGAARAFGFQRVRAAQYRVTKPPPPPKEIFDLYQKRRFSPAKLGMIEDLRHWLFDPPDLRDLVLLWLFAIAIILESHHRAAKNRKDDR